MLVATRHLLLPVLLSAAALPGQELADILPFSLRLDGALDGGGKLVWDVPAPVPCTGCEGKKLVACPKCSRAAAPCGLCREGQSPCRACGATGKALDPFVEIVCPGCDGTQREVCPACRGTASLVSPEGRERPCDSCKGRRSFPCADCGGSGRLPLGADQARDLRALSLEAAIARRDELRALTRHVERRRGEVGRASEPAHEAGLLLDEVRVALDLPSGAGERLLALVAAAAGDDKQTTRGFLVSERTSTLLRRIEAEQSRITTCIWRHRRNAGEFDRPATGPLASTLRWDFPFGEDPQRKDTLWLLLGRGFMRAPQSDDTEAVAAAWLAAHPEAVLQPIIRLEGVGRPPMTSTWIHCRVVDAEHDLALHLVEKGCVPAYVLIALGEEIEVPFAGYLAFLRRANELEAAAKAKKLGVWRDTDPARDDDLAAARKRQFADDHRGALELYEKAILAGHDTPETWTQVGNCRLALGDDAAALVAFERAIAGGRKWEAWRGKARVLWRRDGEAAAVAFLKTVELEPHDVESWHGELCRDADKPDDAIVHYEKAIELASAKHAFAFDADGWLKLDEATLAKNSNDFADLWPTLENVAELHFARGDDRKAMRFATMGVAIGQQLNRCKGYYDATEVAAGDVDCRILRGRLLCKQGKVADAETEERLARALAMRSGYTGYQRRLEVLQQEITAKGRR